jgi:hypothetical protein
MGDDNEIRQLIHVEAEDLLKKAKAVTTQGVVAYDFASEFSGSRKNRSLLVIFGSLATILALGFAAFEVTGFIKKQNDSIPVNVRVFEDLDLKNILSGAKDMQKKVQQAQGEINQFMSDRKNDLDAIDRDHQSALLAISAKASSPEEETALIETERKEWEKKRRATEASYAEKISVRTDELKKLGVASGDQSKVSKAMASQDALDSSGQVLELEKQKLTDEFAARTLELETRSEAAVAAVIKQRDELAAALTARFNPVFSDARSKALIGSWKAPAANPDFVKIADYLVKSSILSPEDIKKYDSSLDNLQYLTGKLETVPWVNSPPTMLSRLKNEAYTSIAGYRGFLDKASKGLDLRDKTIAERDRTIADLNLRLLAMQAERDAYSWSIARHASLQRDDGYVVDTRNPKIMTVLLGYAASVPDGTIALVVRGEKAVGSVRITGRDGKSFASTVSVTPGESIQPLDSIIIPVDSQSAK